MKSFKWIAGVALSLLLAGLAAKNTTTKTCQPDCCIEQAACCPE